MAHAMVKDSKSIGVVVIGYAKVLLIFAGTNAA